MNSIRGGSTHTPEGRGYQREPRGQGGPRQAIGLDQGHPALHRDCAGLPDQGQSAALLDAALANLTDPLANEALKLVLAGGEAAKLFDDVLAGPQAEKLVTLLGTSSEPRIINRLTQIATKANGSLPSRRAAIQALARSQTGAQAIIQLAKNNELPQDLKGSATTALNLVQYPTLKADIAALFPLRPHSADRHFRQSRNS